MSVLVSTAAMPNEMPAATPRNAARGGPLVARPIVRHITITRGRDRARDEPPVRRRRRRVRPSVTPRRGTARARPTGPAAAIQSERCTGPMRHRGAEEQRHENAGREDRFDEHDGREPERGGLASRTRATSLSSPSSQRGRLIKSGEQPGAQRVLVGHLLGLEHLEHVAQRVEERGGNREQGGGEDAA